MVIRKTDDFLKGLARLPKEIQELFHEQERIFSDNWLDPRLHTKQVKEFAGVFSFRVTRRYRVLFYFRGAEAIFFAIGHRKEIYRD